MTTIDLGKNTKLKIYEVMRLLNIQEKKITTIIEAICEFILNNKNVIYYLGSSQQERLANKIYKYLESYWQLGYNPNVLKTMHELGMANDEYAFARALEWLETMDIITIKLDEKNENIKRIIKSKI